MAIVMLALFIAVPIIEIALLIQLGGWIGFWPTLGLVIATAIAGTVLIRAQGQAALRNAIAASEKGEMPVDPAIDAVALLLAGALLLTPGLVTDGLGFLLLVPPLRRRAAKSMFRAAVRRGNVHVNMGGMHRRPAGGQGAGAPPRQPNRAPQGAGPVIDGEFERVSPREPSANETDGDNPWAGRKD